MERDLLDSHPLGIMCFILGRYIHFIQALITIPIYFFKYRLKCTDVTVNIFHMSSTAIKISFHTHTHITHTHSTLTLTPKLAPVLLSSSFQRAFIPREQGAYLMVPGRASGFMAGP